MTNAFFFFMVIPCYTIPNIWYIWHLIKILSDKLGICGLQTSASVNEIIGFTMQNGFFVFSYRNLWGTKPECLILNSHCKKNL